MFNFHLSYQWIHWRRPTGPAPELPEGIERLFVDTVSGPIEILYAAPKSADSKRRAPVFFVHGGMGSAWVWLEYMQYLSSRGITCYAISLRGHGESWQPSFFRMVYLTSKRDLANDLVAGVKWAQEREGSPVVLVGHSSGGGLSQYILSERDVKAIGLALLAAVPGYGSYDVYMNWWKLDPWFTIRMIFHAWHPNSPLSHPALTKAVFFSNDISEDYLHKFQARINAYECFWWPITMMRSFVDPRNVLQQITGWGSGGGQRVLVLAGGGDKLMSVPIMTKLAAFYRNALPALVGEKKIDLSIEGIVKLEGDGKLDDAGQGIQFAVVPAGHHLQNDVQWEIGAKKLLQFFEQL